MKTALRARATLKDLEGAAEQKLTQKQASELWQSLERQGVVKEAGLVYRARQREPVGRVKPEEVGARGFAQPKPITEPSGVPFMMTQKMRTDLFSAGLTREQISEMTPGQAQAYLQNLQKAKELMSEGEIPQGTSKSGKDVIDKTMKRMRKQDEAAEKGIPDDYSCG